MKILIDSVKSRHYLPVRWVCTSILIDTEVDHVLTTGVQAGPITALSHFQGG